MARPGQALGSVRAQSLTTRALLFHLFLTRALLDPCVVVLALRDARSLVAAWPLPRPLPVGVVLTLVLCQSVVISINLLFLSPSSIQSLRLIE
jgi:hypothetical protein